MRGWIESSSLPVFRGFQVLRDESGIEEVAWE